MALFKQVKCGRCDRTYSSIRGRCPYCGARRGSGKNNGGDGDNTRWQVIVGAVVLLAIIAAAIILISISLKGRDAENATPTNTPGGSIGDVSKIDGTDPTVAPTNTPVPTPEPTPTPVATPEPVVNSVVLSRSDFTLSRIGETYTIAATLSPAGTAAEIIWISEDPNVCTVDQNGMVTAVDHGTTIVSATAGGKTAECTVRVSAYAPAGSTGTDTGSSSGPASLSHTDVTIHAADKESFTLSVKGNDGAAVSYSSSDSSIATVDSKGVVTAVSKGYCVITVTVGEQTLKCEVRVSN